ncbi:MAG: 4-hydroxy-3-methylbut-2-enyl diphosphate reductase [Opitutales bacterium]|nr:4-hydroxy-3-methylbut-2-enyl diphosphate reductase [Opitutales bacterium]
MPTPTQTLIALFNHRHRLFTIQNQEGHPVLPTANKLDEIAAMISKRPWIIPEQISKAEPVPLALSRLVDETTELPGIWMTFEQWKNESRKSPLPNLPDLIRSLEKNLYQVPYLGQRDHDYIFRFRTEKQRNREVYREAGESTNILYQSRLCEAIKEVKRANERRSTSPATLDFGPVAYWLPSHFGFCLGVQNAIERAYETIVENPRKRIFMLSELIHNPFVNRDLAKRGLRYLQTDKGVPCLNPETGKPWWDLLNDDDIVIIPAFGATNEDKARLIAKGINFQENDATCMLVEKVWKAAKAYGRKGYTVIIHGKSEHEETKATFSNTLPYAPCLVIRDRHQAGILAEIMTSDDPFRQQELWQRHFQDLASPGFNPEKDLEKIAVVNQTTLLRNETLSIINLLEKHLSIAYGNEVAAQRLHSQSKGDTLCYATQVNQDALEKALEADLDYAMVVGGKNSSNTAQLYRMCREKLGDKAFYIQSEANILGENKVLHYEAPYPKNREDESDMKVREFFLHPMTEKKKILITGGASCPDGLIQQIINRINGFYQAENLNSIEKVLEGIEG